MKDILRRPRQQSQKRGSPVKESDRTVFDVVALVRTLVLRAWVQSGRYDSIGVLLVFLIDLVMGKEKQHQIGQIVSL